MIKRPIKKSKSGVLLEVVVVVVAEKYAQGHSQILLISFIRINLVFSYRTICSVFFIPCHMYSIPSLCNEEISIYPNAAILLVIKIQSGIIQTKGIVYVMSSPKYYTKLLVICSVKLRIWVYVIFPQGKYFNGVARWNKYIIGIKRLNYFHLVSIFSL